MVEKITTTELITKIKNEEELTAVEIIKDHTNNANCSVIINDKLFSMPYLLDYTEDLKFIIKDNVAEDIIILEFEDKELTEAWKQSYLAGGIMEDRWDRRAIFHPYNDMNEMFCIDRNLLWEITDEFKGTPHELTEDKCKWFYTMIQWYKSHLI